MKILGPSSGSHGEVFGPPCSVICIRYAMTESQKHDQLGKGWMCVCVCGREREREREIQ